MAKSNNNQALPVNMYLWLLVASFILSLIICLGALRSNNQKMVELREQVYVADKSGEGVNDSINALRSHVYAHMNTNLSSGSNGIKPPLQLKYTYERLLEAEQKKAELAGSSIYTDAQNYCQEQNSQDFSGRNRVPCVQEYIALHQATVINIPTSAYQFDFVSPTWSPDLAGWSLLAGLIFGLSAGLALLFRLLAHKLN